MFDCHSQAYQERSKYINDQLSALKTQMDDLKMEDRMTRNDLLHEKSIRLGNNKRLALDKVCEFPDVGFYTAEYLNVTLPLLFFPPKEQNRSPEDSHCVL